MDEIVRVLAAEAASATPGALFPSEHTLMKRFEASRSVIRRAVDHLEARYLVRRVQGSGTFVNRRIDFVVSSRLAPSLHETVERAGARARTFLVDAATHPTPDDVAEAFDMTAGDPGTRLVRIGYIDDYPATVSEEWIAPPVAAHIDVSLRAIESLAEVLRASRRTPVRAWSRASIEPAPEGVLERLDLRAPTPVWLLETLTRDGSDGTPLVFSRNRLRLDRVRVVIEFDPVA